MYKYAKSYIGVYICITLHPTLNIYYNKEKLKESYEDDQYRRLLKMINKKVVYGELILAYEI